MIYRYKAYTADKKIVSGTIESTSLKGAEDNLYTAGYQRIIDLSTNRVRIRLEKDRCGPGKIKSRCSVGLLQPNYLFLTESGLTLLLALRQLEKQATSGALKQIVSKLASDLQGGTPFSSGIEHASPGFPGSLLQRNGGKRKSGLLWIPG